MTQREAHLIKEQAKKDRKREKESRSKK